MSKQKRRDLLQLLGTGALASIAMPANAAKLPNIAKLEAAATVAHEPFGEVRVYFDGPTDQLQTMTAGSLTLKPGMEPHPPHQHPEEEIMVITEGSGEIVVEAQLSQVSPGSMMYCGANKLHGIKNTGKTPLKFFYFKWKA